MKRVFFQTIIPGKAFQRLGFFGCKPAINEAINYVFEEEEEKEEEQEEEKEQEKNEENSVQSDIEEDLNPDYFIIKKGVRTHLKDEESSDQSDIEEDLNPDNFIIMKGHRTHLKDEESSDQSDIEEDLNPDNFIIMKGLRIHLEKEVESLVQSTNSHTFDSLSISMKYKDFQIDDFCGFSPFDSGKPEQMFLGSGLKSLPSETHQESHFCIPSPIGQTKI